MPVNQMIQKKSNQLFIDPYAIEANAKFITIPDNSFNHSL